jgi:TatD DNase family protein
VKNCGLVDIGVNLSNNRFKDDLEDILTRAQQSSVAQMILTGTSESETTEVIELCERFAQQYPDMLYATAGIHPHYADEFNSSSIKQLENLAKHPKIVAIGETGLDFNRNFSSANNQIIAFEAQLELASRLNMPLFMHERDAAIKQIDILKSYRDHFSQGVIHCFTGDRKTLFSYLDLDLHIGITGWVCDPKRGLELQQLVANIPLDRLMIESDAPYLLPKNMHPLPKNRRNEPAFLSWVLAGVASVRNESPETIAAATSETAKRFFGI